MRYPSVAAPAAPPWSDIAERAIITADTAEATLADLERLHQLFLSTQIPAAVRLIRVAHALARGDLRRRAQLVTADVAIRQGDLETGSATAREVLAEAEADGDGYALARAHYLLAWAAHTIGDLPGAQINGVRSIELLPVSASPEILMDHLTITAIAANPSPDSDAYFAEALAIAEQCGDPVRIYTIHNNVAYAAIERDDLVTARRHVALMIQVSKETDTPLSIPQLDTAGRLYNADMRYREAIALLEPVTQMLAAPETEALADTRLALGLLTLARSWRGLGDWGKAQHYLDEAKRRAISDGMAALEAQIVEEQAYLYADQGDFRQAYIDYVAFHDAVLALQSEDRQAKARIAQASFNAERNRQQAEHFRDLAMRDSLTGLYNRRYLDDLLAAEIEQASREREPLSLAIIDADFFKRINDELSHDVGDQVLRTLAAVLLDNRPAGSTVCRLGGEEFVLVLPRTSAVPAVQQCEALRTMVAAHPWHELTGPIPLTVSIGVATAATGRSTLSSLLSEADRHLYAVKRSGRNRVMGDARWRGDGP